MGKIRLRRSAPFIAALLLLALYLAFLERVFVFDGVLFAGIIERASGEWRQELFNRRHLLFNPLMMLARDALSAVGCRASGYSVMQYANALAGAAGFLVFRDLLARATRRRWTSLALALLLAVSNGYWARATEGQVYMLMTFWSLLSVWAAVRLVQAPSLLRAYLLAGVCAAAVLFHAANACLAPMALAALVLASRRLGRVSLLGPAAAGVLLAALPFIWAFELHGLDSLRAFLVQATESYTPEGAQTWGGFIASFFSSGGPGAPARIPAALDSFFRSCAGGVPPGHAGWVAGAAMWAGLLWALARSRSRLSPLQRQAALLFGLWAGASLCLEAFWRGGYFFGAVPAAGFLALSALALPRRLPLRRRGLVPAAAAALALALGSWNFAQGALPRSRLEDNRDYRDALFIRDHTVATCWVVVAGYGRSNLKVYIPYFAKRSRQVLEYFLDRHPKARALDLFSGFLRRCYAHGIPVYVHSELFDDEGVRAFQRERFDVSPEEVRACFGPGRFLTAAATEGMELRLFVPQGFEDRLFAGLTYSVLRETGDARLGAAIGILKELAGSMTPAQRRRAAENLEGSWYGGKLLLQGFAPTMSPDSLRAAVEKARSLAEKPGPQAQLRLGNLYLYLEDPARAEAAWSEALRATGDPGIAENIRRLRSRRR